MTQYWRKYARKNRLGFNSRMPIRANEATADIPVIFLTSDDDSDTETRGLEAGAMDFIKKPFIPDVLLQRINHIIELTRLQADLAPMDYRENDEWTGFDAELAAEFAKELGVTPEFVEINWDKKTELLENGSIDCIWNGMTLTEKISAQIDCSQPYLLNSQVIVMSKEDAWQYGTAEECQHLLFAVEKSSSAEALLSEMKYRYTAYPTQKDALQSIVDNKSDAAVIDMVMAGYYTANNPEFSDLDYRLSLNDETLAVGFRKDSDLNEKANAFLSEAFSSGLLQKTAEKYGIAGALPESL